MKLRFLGILILCSFTVGFRVFPGGNMWMISKTEPTLYLKFCEDMVIEQNDVDSDDPLSGATLTHNSVVDSIINDYNSISGAYVTLVDSARDPRFSATLHQHCVIDICFSYQQEMIEGHAKAKYDTDMEHFNGCEIELGKKIQTKAKRLIRTLTHEIGHCLALDHDFDTRHSLMSYFSNVYRLQPDDKAGIVYLYPENPDDVSEHPTFGLACSAR